MKIYVGIQSSHQKISVSTSFYFPNNLEEWTKMTRNVKAKDSNSK